MVQNNIKKERKELYFSDETKKDIAKSIEEYKKGKIFTFEEVKAELRLR